MFNKEIQFVKWPTANDGPDPIPAKKLIPQWYRDGEQIFTVKKSGQTEKVGTSGPGMKSCIPFLDTLISGYLLLTQANIYVKNENNELKISFDDDIKSDPVNIRPEELGNTIPVPAGHNPAHLIWTPVWGWKTPKGYSSLITHPLNRHDLPFTTLSGIIDSDKFWGPGNVPFFIKNDFSGTIEKGTPFAQIIPIKRDSWQGFVDDSLIEETISSGEVVRALDAFYKKYIYIKKDYGEKK